MVGKRLLTEQELHVLRLVQELHGPQNTEGKVSFTDAGEACIWAENDAGVPVVVVNLTNLAAWHRAGELSDGDMRDWIAPGRTEDEL